MSTNKYDIIIAGGGLSGLSLAWYLAKGEYSGEVLLVDETFAPQNNKTWCFWSKTKPPFHEIVYRTWKKAFVSALDLDAYCYMTDYSYYCIRESDFKEHVLRELRNHKNFTLLEEPILDFSSNKNKAVLITKSSDTYLADYIFQSIFKPDNLNENTVKYPLIQHFHGLEIKANRPVFDSATFVMMDFDESFKEGPAFMYVLPYKENRGLVEFTVFSEQPLKKKKKYRKKIYAYLEEKYGLTRDDYEVKRKEYGEIPMEHRPHSPYYSSKVINMGTMGGLTKPSTGYTFTRIQQHVQELASSLIEGKDPVPPKKSEFRYRYYDLLLLHIMANSTGDSLRIFRDLFRKNHIDKIFDFLSEDTSFRDDLKIMSSVPYTPFFKAIAKNLKV